MVSGPTFPPSPVSSGLWVAPFIDLSVLYRDAVTCYATICMSQTFSANNLNEHGKVSLFCWHRDPSRCQTFQFAYQKYVNPSAAAEFFCDHPVSSTSYDSVLPTSTQCKSAQAKDDKSQTGRLWNSIYCNSPVVNRDDRVSAGARIVNAVDDKFVITNDR